MSQLKAGAILSYLSIIISMLIALIYTPIMIRLLGQSEFGLYSLIGSLAAYFSVMDMGLGNAMVRFSARNRIIANEKEIAKLNGMFLTLYSLIGIITVAVGIIVFKNIELIFENSFTEEELRKAKIMVIILIVNFSVSFPLSVFNSIIRAYEKFIVEGLLSITRIIMSPIIIIPVLLLGYGSVSMVLITTIVNISCLFYALIFCFSKLKIKIHLGKIDTKILKEVLGYSFFVFLNVIVDQFFWKTDQIILGIVSGTSIVAVYAIAMQFITMYMKFSTAIANLFLPRISMMEAKKVSSGEFTNEMIKFGRVQFLIISLIISGFILFGYDFIIIWAGNTYEDAYIITLIIMLPLTVPLIQNIGISILQAKNKHGFRSIVYLVVAVIKVIITIPLAKNFGGIGAATATVVSLVLAHIVIMNFYYHKKIGLDMVLFWNNILRLIIPVGLSITIGYIGITINPYNNIPIVVLEIVLFTLIYISLIWFIGMNSYEKNLVKGFLNKGLNILMKR